MLWVDGIYYGALVLLAVLAVHRLVLAVAFFRLRGRRNESRGNTETGFPFVTVQLPIFNERFVVRRLLRACAGLEYPKDRFEIQVLDDSTDGTSAIVQEEIDRLRGTEPPVFHIRRIHREGFKAGALQAGLASARGELIAIFDADFVPPPEFLMRAMPLFHDPAVGLVQARWGHLNEEENDLTRAQALMLDGHFNVEQFARAERGLFFNFNGTAGIWRRSAIEEAGGWQSDTLTEDLDLSYRAQLAGWRFRYLPDLVVPAELPADVRALKAQQSRWAKGASQSARKLLLPVLFSGVRPRQKLEAVFHLLSNVGYPLLLLLALTFPVASLRVGREGFGGWIGGLLFWILTLGGMTVFVLSSRSESGTRMKEAFFRIPLLIAVCVGLSLNNARAVLEGFFVRGGEFVRTPKKGFGRTTQDRSYRCLQSSGSALEFVFAVYFLVCAAFHAAMGVFSTLPLLWLFASGFGFVALRGWRETRGPATPQTART